MKSASITRARGLASGSLRALVLALCAAPLAVLAARGLQLSQVGLVWHLGTTVLPMEAAYSLLAATGAVLLGAVLAAGGVLCGIFDFRGRRLLQRLLLVPLLVPPWFFAVLYQDRFGLNGSGGLVLILAVCFAPLFQLFVAAALLDIPVQHLDMLRTVGRGSPARLVRHLLPFAIPAATAAAVLVFLLAWGDGACARILAVPTLTVGMYDQWFGRQADAAGASFAIGLIVASLIPTLLVLALVARRGWSERGRLQRGGMERVRLRGPASLVPWLLGAPLLVAGVIVPGVVVGGWTVDHIARTDFAELGGDVLSSLLLALAATAVAGALAMVVLRDRVVPGARRFGLLASRLLVATFAIPPLALALAFLWLLPESAGSVVISSVNSTPGPLAVALGLRYCAVVLVAGEAAALRSARTHADLLSVQGRTDLLSFARLFRPFLTRPMMAAACFVFLEALKDLSLSTVLQPFGFSTVAMRMFEFSQTQRVHECAVWILCLVLVGAYPLSLLARLADGDRAARLPESG